MLKVSDICLDFSDTEVLKKASFNLEHQQVACLLGESGCGKTTLLRSIAGLEKPHSGSISLAGNILTDDDPFVAAEHGGIGFVFQDYALFPHLTIAENICFALKNKVNKSVNKSWRKWLNWSNFKINYTSTQSNFQVDSNNVLLLRVH